MKKAQGKKQYSVDLSITSVSLGRMQSGNNKKRISKNIIMRNKTILGLVALLLIIPHAQHIASAQGNVKGQISISGAFALYPLAVKWAEEYKKINPGVKIDISAGGAGKGMTDALSGIVDIGMVSRDVAAEEIKKGALAIAVAKDAVVATISANNPSLQSILSTGLKQETGKNIWITGKYKTWGQAFNNTSKAPLRVYTRSDACGAAEIWSKYFGKKQEDLLGSGVFGDPGVALAVKKDAVGIGFNNIGYVYDAKTKKQVKGIRVLPLDLNNNGKIDADENFYDNLDQLMAAIGNGKYPSPPSRLLYFVTKGSPSNKATSAFVKWVLSDGQKYVSESGFISLPADRLTTELAKVK
jgi:phosphate transport system substrate-binding protein